MTGFGRSHKAFASSQVTVEMKSVNHRFCEFQMRMPKQLFKIEDRLKKAISKYIKRGRVDVFITITGEGLMKRRLHIDWELLDEFHQFLGNVQRKYGITSKLSLNELLNHEDLVTIEEIEEGNEEIELIVLEAVTEAAAQLKSMREKEGLELQKDLQTQLMLFENCLLQIKENSNNVTDTYKSKLEKRILEFTNGFIDEQRILQEVAIFTDKADIHEEITRLDSHILQFRHTLDLQEPIGRKLDFMIQEMNREVNTIGSKANHSDISKAVVDLKTILEKMREQVQNIE